jgi:ElaB/YqjD/DUF883 family membrane-anchored ribosome-binding protein
MTGSPYQGSSFGQPRQTSGGTQGNRPEESGLGGVASAVKEKAREVASSASDLAGQVKDTARDLASSATSSASQAWDSTQRQARELASDTARYAENAWDSFGNFVRRYPVASLCVALGVGFLLASGLAAGARRQQRW